MFLGHIRIPVFQRIRFLVHPFPTVSGYHFTVQLIGTSRLVMDDCLVVILELRDLEWLRFYLLVFQFQAAAGNAVGIYVMIFLQMVFLAECLCIPTIRHMGVVREQICQCFRQ